MALNFKDLVIASQEYAKAERNKQTTKESISTEQLNDLVKQSIAMGGDTNANMLKLYEELKKQTSFFMANKKESTAVAEDKEEAAKIEKEQTDTLKKIAENTDPKNIKKEKKEEVKDSGLGLGAVITGITVALSALAGVISAYVKNIKFFLNLLTPDALKIKIGDTFSNIQKMFSEFGLKIQKILSESFTKLKSLFVFDETSNIGKIISKFKSGLDKFLIPFKEAFSTIQSLMSGSVKGLSFIGDIVSKISNTISSVGKYLSKIGVLFKGVFSVVEKIALPLFAIMTLWDTVKGTIEGFEKNGIIGAIGGAIKGLINSLIMAPLDMLKSAVSWITGAFGFDKVEQLLDAFSFEGMFSTFIDALTSPLDALSSIVDKVGGMIDEYIMQPLANAFAPVTEFFKSIKDSIVGFFEAIEIPKIGFTIPIINKEVSIGPFYPFKKAQTAPSTAQTAPSASTADTIKPTYGKTVNGEPDYETASAALMQSQDKLQRARDRRMGKQEPIDTSVATPSVIPNTNVVTATPSTAVVTAVSGTVTTVVTPEAPQPQAANAVYGASAENAAATQAVPSAPIVVAPTNITNNTKNEPVKYRGDTRNVDSTFTKMLNSRFMPV